MTAEDKRLVDAVVSLMVAWLTGQKIVHDFVQHRISSLKKTVRYAWMLEGIEDSTKDGPRELPEEQVKEMAFKMLKNVKDDSNPISFDDQPSSLIGASTKFINE